MASLYRAATINHLGTALETHYVENDSAITNIWRRVVRFGHKTQTDR